MILSRDVVGVSAAYIYFPLLTAWIVCVRYQGDLGVAATASGRLPASWTAWVLINPCACSSPIRCSPVLGCQRLGWEKIYDTTRTVNQVRRRVTSAKTPTPGRGSHMQVEAQRDTGETMHVDCTLAMFCRCCYCRYGRRQTVQTDSTYRQYRQTDRQTGQIDRPDRQARRRQSLVGQRGAL
jgi:hypothetical protein